MALTQVNSEGIKDGEVKNADMADDAIGVAELSATGTASNTTFLRGDNSWVTPTDTNTTYSVGDGGLTQNNFTDADHTKLDGIAAGAEVNVQSDWNSSSGDSQILNKPTVPTVTGSTDNTITTVTGANAIQGEANLTFDGTTLTASGSTTAANNTNTDANIIAGSQTLIRQKGNHAGIGGDAYPSQIISGTAGGDLELYTINSNCDVVVGTQATEKLRINSTGDLLLGTTTVPTSYLSSNTLAVIDNADANAGCIEIGGSTNGDTYNAGSIHFINNANSNSSTPWNANAKIVCLVRAEIETSDSNAGDDSGADLVVYRKPEAGAGTEGVRIMSTGNVKLADGNLVVASGHGIDFSATSDGPGTTNSELLDDYEEGYYVPTLNSNLSHSSGSYNTFSYTKVGRVVTVRGLFYPGSWSGSDAVTVSLPFASADLTQIANAGGQSVMFNKIDGGSAGLACFVEDNITYMKFYLLEGDNSAWVRLNNSHFNTGSEIYLCITYFST